MGIQALGATTTSEIRLNRCNDSQPQSTGRIYKAVSIVSASQAHVRKLARGKRMRAQCTPAASVAALRRPFSSHQCLPRVFSAAAHTSSGARRPPGAV